VTPHAYQLELPASIQIHRVQYVSLFNMVVEDPVEGQVGLPPLRVEVDGEEKYDVSTVEDSWPYEDQLQYLIRWMTYDSRTWQPAKFVYGLRGVEEFHQQYPGEPGRLEYGLRGPRA